MHNTPRVSMLLSCAFALGAHKSPEQSTNVMICENRPHTRAKSLKRMTFGLMSCVLGLVMNQLIVRVIGASVNHFVGRPIVAVATNCIDWYININRNVACHVQRIRTTNIFGRSRRSQIKHVEICNYCCLVNSKCVHHNYACCFKTSRRSEAINMSTCTYTFVFLYLCYGTFNYFYVSACVFLATTTLFWCVFIDEE